METTTGGDITANLRYLGTGALPAPEHGPGIDILDAFPNRFPGRDYVISMACPEFTSLCPMTGQPDFATIVLEYIPDQLCVESKSFKLYIFSYRNHRSFMETITNTMLEHFVEKLAPRWARIKGLFTPRGGTRMHVFAEYYKELPEKEAMALRETVRDWKMELDPHRP